MEVLVAGGYEKIDCVLMCGGLSKNELFVQTQANVVSRPVLVPQRTESVLLGSSMLAAAAAKIYPDVPTAIANMAGTAVQIKPIAKVSRYLRIKKISPSIKIKKKIILLLYALFQIP
jgi:ribulose kinase